MNIIMKFSLGGRKHVTPQKATDKQSQYKYWIISSAMASSNSSSKQVDTGQQNSPKSGESFHNLTVFVV
jgi:hypothetical protein